MNAIASYLISTLINKIISGVITALVVSLGIIIGVNIIKKAIPSWIDKLMEYQETRHKNQIEIERIKMIKGNNLFHESEDSEVIALRMNNIEY